MTKEVIEDQIDKTQWLGKDEKVILPQRKGQVVAVEGKSGGREYRSLAAPLEHYVARRHISGNQYRAGCRLHALWRGSIIAARYSTMRLGDPKGDSDPESMALMPRDYFRAMDAVGDFHTQRVIRLVCCFGEPCGSGRSMELLKVGLDALEKHFRN